jgi:PEP-CTERM motif-containing protein
MLKFIAPWPLAFASLTLLAPVPASAAPTISAGSPSTSVPTALDDPFGSLVPPLPADQFLLPVEITGATDLQDWSFDLTFDENVVSPKDVGGPYQSVYQAEFNNVDAILSDITSSGVLVGDGLEGIAGFSSWASGDGTLAYILFEYLPGQAGNDPDFGIEDATTTQSVPEPATLALLAGGLAALAGLRRRPLRGCRE